VTNRHLTVIESPRNRAADPNGEREVGSPPHVGAGATMPDPMRAISRCTSPWFQAKLAVGGAGTTTQAGARHSWRPHWA